MRDELAAFLRPSFDPHGERAAPAGLYWPDADEPRQVFGLGGPDRRGGRSTLFPGSSPWTPVGKSGRSACDRWSRHADRRAEGHGRAFEIDDLHRSKPPAR
jgi:hypothetical protein